MAPKKPLILLALAVLFLWGCENRQGFEPGTATIRIVTLGKTLVHNVSFDKPTTLLDSLEASHNITLTGFRNFIKCVDDVCAKGGYSWRITSNGLPIASSAKSYVLKPNDSVTVEYS